MNRANVHVTRNLYSGRAGLWLLAALALLGVARPCQAQGRLEIDAIAGKPFGVGRVAFVADPRAGEGDARDVVAVTERNGRVLYPAVGTAGVRRLVRQLLAAPPRVEVYFLFQGDGPLELTLYSPTPLRQTVAPRGDERGHAELLRRWWRQYLGVGLLRNTAEYPRVVDNYLTSMLAKRLDLQMGRGNDEPTGEFQRALGLLGGTEEMQLSLARRTLLGESAGGVADRPVPAPLQFAPPEIPKLQEPPTIEPLAMKVPPECLYMRFGNFTNYLWFRDRLNAWGGDARSLISERGIDYHVNIKMENQLGLHETALSRVLGPTVISDVAFIGTDTFMREGAALGILFEARSSPLLGNDLTRQREEQMAATNGAKEETVKIAGHDVSWIHSDDNRMRSFYAVDGDYHLVTTSRYLAERFLQVAADKKSLGATPEFQYARSRLPVSRDDTAFLYLSSSFFENLLSPKYYLEMRRRAQSLAEVSLLMVAQRAAAAEGQPHDRIADLVTGGFLPNGFGTRPDGSKLEIVGEQFVDSLRGAPGTYAPVPDAAINKISPAEEQAYARFAEFHRSQWRETEPVLVGIRRQDSERADLEQVTIDAIAAPMTQNHLDFANRFIGPPSDQRLAAVPGDVVSFQAALRGDSPGAGTADYFLFGGLRNAPPMQQGRPTLLDLLGQFSGMQGVNGYLGAWPNPGLLRWIGILGAPVDPNGYSQLRIGLWRRQWNQFTALSFHPEVLAEVTPQLAFQQTSHPSQIWIRLEDLLESRVADFVNAKGFDRARGVSAGNVRFLHSLSEQLHVPRAQALADAERLVGGSLVCPLGGEFRLIERPGGLATWTTTMLGLPEGQAMSEYRFPALHWLRKLDAEARIEQSGLVAHIVAEMPTTIATKAEIRQFQERAADSGSRGPLPPVEEVPPSR